MLAEVHEGKTDDTTVALVRRIAELAYAKHGDLDRTDDLGAMLRTRLETFLDGAWYEATANALKSKLKAKKLYQKLKYTEQVVLFDFRVADLCNVFGIEGLCYEYWWASAAMRTIGKGAVAKWENDRGLTLGPVNFLIVLLNSKCRLTILWPRPCTQFELKLALSTDFGSFGGALSATRSQLPAAA